VEDNPGDADLTRESLEGSARLVELTVAVSGTEAVDYIHKRGRFASAPTPDLVLLDLNLPGIDGRGVLAEIKQHAEWKRVPVSILTSSAAEEDIAESYDLGANCYVVKPLDFKSFEAIVQALGNFWFSIVKLPRTQKQSQTRRTGISAPHRTILG
jgi:two-component system response regulator